MSDQTEGRPEPREAAELRVEALEVSPGRPASAVVSLTNRGTRAATFELSVHGIDPGWVDIPRHVGPIRPGTTIEVRARVHLPAGYPASRLVGVVAARATGPGTAPSEPGTAGAADLVVTVADGSLVRATLDPAETRGWRRGRLHVVLWNRGPSSTKVELSGHSAAPGVEVRFADPAPVLPPGRELRVPTRVRGPRPWAGGERRRLYGVRVQARSTPVALEGTLVQRPLLSGRLLKTTAIVVVVALWAAAAVVGIGALTTHLQRNASAKAASSSPPLKPGTSPTGGPGASSSGGSSGTSGTAGATGERSPAGSGGGTVRVGGKVTAAEPGGVTVTIAPTSLTDPGSSGATLLTGATLTAAHFPGPAAGSGAMPLGKVYGTAVGDSFDAGLTAVAGVPTTSTTTAPDGSWAISDLRAPGDYLVTFSKPGFTTRKYLLTATKPGSTLHLDASISPGFGSIAGSVSGPGGRLGGVSVTLTDGTVTLTTRTPSVGGGRGTWAITGLTTPDTYLVTATKPGFGTATTLVHLAASGTRHGVALSLRPGVGTITGTVVSERAATGIGGVSVTATRGSTTESATTTTEGKVGSYTLPNLPVPGTYALTFSGPGWVAQTREVHLRANAVVGASLVSSGADVVGFVDDKAGNGLPAAGIVLSNGTQTYKTLSQSTAPVGRFDFNQVPAGHYVLTVEDYGYQTESTRVVVSPGGVSTRSVILPAKPAQSLATGTIRGSVDDLFDSKGLPGAPVELDGTQVATSGADGTYQLNDVAPGVHVVSASAGGFQSASVQVNVPLGGLAFAPVLNLPKLDTLSGRVTSAAGNGPIPGASVALFPSGASLPSGSATPTTTADLTATAAAATTPPSLSGAIDSMSATSSGTYSIADLKSGNYELVVFAPGYETESQDVSLAVDENLHQDVALTLAPDFNVVTYDQVGNSQGLQQVGGVCVTVKGPGYDHTELTSATKPVTFTPLVAGQSYTASFWQPSSTAGASPVAGVPPSPCPQDDAEIGTAPSTTFTAQVNNTSIYSAFVAPKLPALTVSLTFRYELTGTNGIAKTIDCPVVTVAGAAGPSQCPVLKNAPTVSITGISSFTRTSNGSLGSPVASAPIAAVAPTGTTSDTWSFSTSVLSALVSDQVTLHVDGSGTPLESASPAETLSGSGPASLQLILTPTPVKVTGSVAPPDATVTVNPKEIPVSPQQGATNAATISVSDSAGSLQWADSQLGAPAVAQPGVYELRASATGYEDATDTVDVGVQAGVLTGAPATITLGLVQETTLTVSAANYHDPALSGVAPPTVTLLYDGHPVTDAHGGPVSVTDGLSGTTTAGTSLQLSGPGDTAVFTYLSPSAEAAAKKAGTPGYGVAVVAPGYQTTFDDLSALSPTMTLSPTPVAEAVVTGTVEGTIEGNATSKLDGAQISATLVSGTCPAASAGTPSGYDAGAAPTLQATADAQGGFVLAGDATLAGASGTANLNGGLCPGATYKITASLPGYDSASTTVAKPATGIDALASDLELPAKAMTQEIVVQPATGSGPFPSNALPTVSVSNSLGASFSCDQASPPSGDCVAPSGKADVAVTVYPTAYTYTVSAPNYVPIYLSAISYAPGSAPSVLTVTLQPEKATMNGTVTTPAPGGSTVPVKDLPLQLYSAGGPPGSGAKPVATTSTNASGAYSFDDVANGTYQLIPDPSTGYVDTVPASYSVSYPSLTANLSVEATPLTTLEVGLTATASSATNLSDATVVLTPRASGGTSCLAGEAATQPLLVAGVGQSLTVTPSSGTSAGLVEFDVHDVIPDHYTLEVSGPTIPPQPSQTIDICPTSEPNTVAKEPVTVQEVEVGGQLTLTGTATTAPTPAVTVLTPGPRTLTATVTGSCALSNAPTCSYTAYLPLPASGGTYTVTASAMGDKTVTASWDPNANPAKLNENFTLSP